MSFGTGGLQNWFFAFCSRTVRDREKCKNIIGRKFQATSNGVVRFDIAHTRFEILILTLIFSMERGPDFTYIDSSTKPILKEECLLRNTLYRLYRSHFQYTVIDEILNKHSSFKIGLVQLSIWVKSGPLSIE